MSPNRAASASTASTRAASLVARDVHRSFGGLVVLDGVDLRVSPGERVGIVGPNGVGKSTLLRILAGLETPDAGSIELSPPSATVGLLDQERPAGRETVLEHLGRRTGVVDAEHALTSAADALGHAEPAPDADDRYAVALERFLSIGGPDFEARAEGVVDELGLGAELLHREVGSLSGGQSARVGLATFLLASFDVLLLDEPTNDLDFDGLTRLEEWLVGLDVGVALVSHDRAFLERVVTDVFELDEHTRRGTRFQGGWAAYQDERATARRHAEEAYADYQGKRQTLRDRALRERQWATTGVAKVKRSGETDKFIRHFNTQSSEQLAARAKRTEQAMARLDVVDKPWEGWRLEMTIAGAPPAGARAIDLAGVVVGHPDGFQLGPIDLVIGSRDRVGITGANGSGKTTLLSVVLGTLRADQGDRRLGPGTRLGVVGQSRHRFTSAGTLREAFIDATTLDRAEAQSVLAKFGLGADDINRAPAELSPGERTRAELALLMATGVNCLVLDEPTNHLDLPALDQLEAALDAFDGTLVLVTHDRALLDHVHLHRMLTLAGGQLVDDVIVG